MNENIYFGIFLYVPKCNTIGIFIFYNIKYRRDELKYFFFMMNTMLKTNNGILFFFLFNV